MQNELQKTMNATIIIGEYTNKQNIKKKKYLNIGTLFLYKNGGMNLKLDALPNANQIISFYDIKPKQQNQSNQGQNYQQQNQNYQ